MWLIIVLSMLFSITGTLFLDGIACEHNILVYWGILVLFCLFCYQLQEWIEDKNLRYGAWYLLCFALFLFLLKPLWNGAKCILSCLVDSMNQYYETGFTKIIVADNQWFVLALMVWGTLLLMPHIIWEEYKPMKWWLMFEGVLVSIAAGLLLGNAPNALWTVVALVLLMIYRIWGNGQLFNGTKGTSYAVPVKAIVIFMAFSILMGNAATKLIQKYHAPFKEFINNIEDEIRLFDWAGIGQGNLTNDAPVKTHETMLSVSLSWYPAMNVYFPGFTGGDYTGGRWKRPDTSAYKKMLKENKIEDEEATLRLETFPYHLGDEDGYEMSCAITYEGVSDSYAYFPYFSNYYRKKESLIENGDAKFRHSSNESEVVKFYELYDVMNGIEEYELGLGYYDEEYSKKMQPLRDAYSEYVKETYLTVPGDLKEKLLAYMGEEAENAKADYTVIPYILENNATYSLELDDLKWGEDYVEHFLFKEKKGYCSHFATAATLMYRSVGIPARYVTGYVLKAGEDDEWEISQLGYSVDITDDAAHAWVEIYMDSCGWIPVEVTPGFASAYENGYLYSEDDSYLYEDMTADMDTTTQAKSASGTTKSSNPEVATENPSGANKADGKQKAIFSQKTGKAVTIILLLLTVSAVAAAIFIGKRKWEMHMRHHEDAEVAINAIRKQLLRYFKRNGYEKQKNETEKEYFMRAAAGLWEKQQNIKLYVAPQKADIAGESIKKLSQDTETAENITKKAEAFWMVLEKQAYSSHSLVKSDVRTCNQLFDCLVKSKF